MDMYIYIYICIGKHRKVMETEMGGKREWRTLNSRRSTTLRCSHQASLSILNFWELC